eukprot:1150195-Pelagomonas_calceolata.AAC.8
MAVFVDVPIHTLHCVYTSWACKQSVHRSGGEQRIFRHHCMSICLSGWAKKEKQGKAKSSRAASSSWTNNGMRELGARGIDHLANMSCTYAGACSHVLL